MTFLNPPSTRVIRDNHVNGIAATSSKRGNVKVFFSPLTSLSMFQVDASILKNEEVATGTQALGRAIKEFKGKQRKDYFQLALYNCLDKI